MIYQQADTLSLISPRSQWLIDVSQELPNAQLDGFDISPDQFPNRSWLPTQIKLGALDITQPLPTRLEGLYDIVHVQLFLCVVSKDGPSNILNQIYKMLSPSSPEAMIHLLNSVIQSLVGIFNGSNMTLSLSK